MPRRFPRAILFFTVLLDMAGFGMILPLLPFYAQRFGADAFEVGVLFAGYSLAQAVFAPLVGRLSDRFGRRPVLLVTIAGSVAAHLLFAAARSFPLLLVARLASGAAAANFSIAQAYVADVTPPRERARGLGLVGAALGMGFVVGPAMGGLLSLASQVAVPLGAAALSLANLALVAARLPESLPRESRREPARHSWLPLASLFAQKRVVVATLALHFAVLFAFATMEATLALYCEHRFSFGVVETSILLVAMGLVIAGVQGGLIGRLVTHFGERRLVWVGIALMSVGLFALPLAPRVLLLGLATAVLAVGNGIHQPSLLGLVSQMSAEGTQGEVLGLARSMGAYARATGPLWGGWLFVYRPAWPFWSASALMALALLFALWLLRRPSFAALQHAGAPSPAAVPRASG